MLGSLLRPLAKLPVSSFGTCLRKINTGNCLLIKPTPFLYAEPLKKKKKMDPAILKHREERRKKKLEKQIRKLEKNARQLKPIDEMEPPFKLIEKKATYSREAAEFTYEEAERRALLLKDWCRYKGKQHLENIQILDRLVVSQKRALDELKKESKELYHEAIQIDPLLIPIVIKGPSFTPPIKDYDSPDGEYIDTTKKWENE